MQGAARLIALIFAGVAASLIAPAQTPAPQPAAAPSIAFDTVSVKANKSNDAHPGSMLRPDGFDAENITPIWVMYWCFGQVAHDDNFFSGLPGWASNERFDIIAKVTGADVPVWQHMSDAEKEQMVHDIFADRFKLQTHVEMRERPVYALVVGKGGAKLAPAKPVPESMTKPSANGFSIRPTDGWFGYSRTGIVAGNVTMEEFAAHLTTLKLGREVQDRTSLRGRYDLKLDFAPVAAATAPSAGGTALAPDASPDLFTAIQEQLGLKLEPARGPVKTIVIDRMERPTEN